MDYENTKISQHVLKVSEPSKWTLKMTEPSAFLSEFSGLWKHQNNPAYTKNVRAFRVHKDVGLNVLRYRADVFRDDQSPCQSSVQYGNIKITQHALKASEPSESMSEFGGIWKHQNNPACTKIAITFRVHVRVRWNMETSK